MLDLVITWKNSLKETYSYQDNSDPEQLLFSSLTDFNHSDLTNNLNSKPFNSGKINSKNWVTLSLLTLIFIRSCDMIILSALMISSLRPVKLSPRVNPIQALQLLQECIKIMPPTGGNGRPVGRPVPALYL